MATKTRQLQIRVTPAQKAALKRRAAAAGCDVSRYVLARVLPPAQDRFAELLRALEAESDPRFALAALHDFLHACPPTAFGEAFARARLDRLSPYLQNTVAAMVEHAAQLKGVAAPAWVEEVAPLDAPHFAAPLTSLRMHLLRSAPVPFKRRNLFVDAGIGTRV